MIELHGDKEDALCCAFLGALVTLMFATSLKQRTT